MPDKPPPPSPKLSKLATIATLKERASPKERKRRIERYAQATAPVFAANLLAARSKLVAAYRKSPSSWPDGIDSPLNRWYVAEQWSDQGTYLGINPNPRPRPGQRKPPPTPSVTKTTETPVTKTQDVTKTSRQGFRDKGGRPKSATPLSPAERKRRQRERSRETTKK